MRSAYLGSLQQRGKFSLLFPLFEINKTKAYSIFSKIAGVWGRVALIAVG